MGDKSRADNFRDRVRQDVIRNRVIVKPSRADESNVYEINAPVEASIVQPSCEGSVILSEHDADYVVMAEDHQRIIREVEAGKDISDELLRGFKSAVRKFCDEETASQIFIYYGAGAAPHDEGQRDLLTCYSQWLEKHGYTDCDWWCEPPSAVDRFLAEVEGKRDAEFIDIPGGARKFFGTEEETSD